MSKTQAAVEKGAIGCSIISPVSQKNDKKTSSFHKNTYKNKRKAFSVAEATIALLIGSVALGMAAPMITKQIKAQNMTDTQFRVINSRNQDLLSRINELEESLDEMSKRIEELENADVSGVPKGTIAFFDSTVKAESTTNPCPEGWELISQNWNGRFPRFAGSYTVYSWNGSTKKHNNTGTTKKILVGSTEEDAIRNITGSVQGAGDRDYSKATGAFSVSGLGPVPIANSGEKDYVYSFNAQNIVPTAIENIPKSIALLGCRKI